MSTPPSLDALLSHQQFIRRVARAVLHDDDAADDVVQETMAIAIQRGPHDASRLKGWLAAVARNAARGRLRREKRRTLREERAMHPREVISPSEALERQEYARLLLGAILALPAAYRDVLLARYYEDLPMREVARLLGVPLETARTRSRRGIERLRQQFGSEIRRTGRDARKALVAMAAIHPASAAGRFGALWAAALLAAGLLVGWMVVRPDSTSDAGVTESDAGEHEAAGGDAAPTLAGLGLRAKPQPPSAASRPREPAGPWQKLLTGTVRFQDSDQAVGGGSVRLQVQSRDPRFHKHRLKRFGIQRTQWKQKGLLAVRLTTKISAAGRYKLEVPADAQLLAIELLPAQGAGGADGQFAPTRLDLGGRSLPSAGSMDFHVDSGSSLVGLVLDAETGLPIEGATVSSPFAGDGGWPVPPVKTLEDGTFQVRGLVGGKGTLAGIEARLAGPAHMPDLHVVVRRAGYLRAEQFLASPAPGGSLPTVRIEMERASKFRGRVTLHDGQEPGLTHVVLLAHPPGGGRSALKDLWWETTTARDGSFEFSEIPAGCDVELRVAPASLPTLSNPHGGARVGFDRHALDGEVQIVPLEPAAFLAVEARFPDGAVAKRDGVVFQVEDVRGTWLPLQLHPRFMRDPPRTSRADSVRIAPVMPGRSQRFFVTAQRPGARGATDYFVGAVEHRIPSTEKPERLVIPLRKTDEAPPSAPFPDASWISNASSHQAVIWRAQVLDADTGELLRGRRVHVETAGWGELRTVSKQGELGFHLEPGEHVISVQCAGYEAESFVLRGAPGERKHIKLRLRRLRRP